MLTWIIVAALAALSVWVLRYEATHCPRCEEKVNVEDYCPRCGCPN